MAKKEFYHDIDLVKVGQLVNSRFENVTDATMSTLAGTLGADNKGLVVYNVDQLALYIWNGTAFVEQAVEIAGDLIFKGVVDASATLDGQVEKITGYQYVVGTAGTLSATGVTFEPSAVAEVGDVFFFTAPDKAYVIQRNDLYATEGQSGNIRLATQAEVNAGVEATEAVTPATLQGKLDNGKYTSAYFASVNLAAATPLTVTHNLGLQDRDAFTVNTMFGNSQISLDVDSVDANSITLTSLVALTGVKVTVVGY